MKGESSSILTKWAGNRKGELHGEVTKPTKGQKVLCSYKNIIIIIGVLWKRCI